MTYAISSASFVNQNRETTQGGNKSFYWQGRGTTEVLQLHVCSGCVHRATTQWVSAVARIEMPGYLFLINIILELVLACWGLFRLCQMISATNKLTQLLGFPLLAYNNDSVWVIRSILVFTIHTPVQTCHLSQSSCCSLQVNLLTPDALCRWRSTMEMNWLQTSCTTRFTPSSMPTSKRLPSPRVLQARGGVAESPGRQERTTATIRQMDAWTLPLSPPLPDSTVEHSRWWRQGPFNINLHDVFCFVFLKPATDPPSMLNYARTGREPLPLVNTHTHL